MARFDDDTWDLANGVGATATGVAAGRALASRAVNPLINDPFAEPLVRAVGVDGHGWATSADSVPELLAVHGLSLPVGADEETETLTGMYYVTARRT